MGQFFGTFFKHQCVILQDEFIHSDRILLRLGNKIIDATDFIQKHPGGAETIMKKNKCDITIDYNFHSKASRQLMDQMIVGTLQSTFS